MKATKRKQRKGILEARRLQVLQYTIAGASSRAAASQLEKDGYGKVSHTTVQKDLKTILGKLAEDNAEEAVNLRALMNERYNRVFLSWWQYALGKAASEDNAASPPNAEATSKVLSILKSMRELNGLDVSVKQRHEHAGHDGGPLAQRVEVVWAADGIETA